MTPPVGLRRWLTCFGAGFADVGILLPVALALIALNGLNPVTVLVCTGLMYLLTGLYFRLPMPVQPLKAMAAIALATGAGADLLGAAGVAMGVTLLLLSFPAPLAWIRRLFPHAIVRGVQLGVGLMLLGKAAAMMTGADAAGQLAGADAVELVAGAVVLSGSAVALARRWGWMVPLVLALSLAGAALWSGSPDTAATTLSLSHSFSLVELSPQLLLLAWLTLVLPQLPLTLGNAVMATDRTARDYFGGRAARVTPGALCRSLGLGNVAIGLVGGMPVCHGSGGMSAHVRMGASSQAATVLFGGLLIVAGVWWGPQIVPWLQLIPLAVFGALLVPVGWAHAVLARDVFDQPANAAVALAVAVIGLATQNLMLGLLAGWLVIGSLHVRAAALPG